MARVPDWLNALEVEASRQAGRFGAFESLYVGGGTPSALADEALDRLVGILRRSFSFEADLEATIEVNPGDVGPDRARRLRALGFDRASVGVQSFVQTELRLLGRRHDVAQAEAALGALRESGFENLGVDLIQGLPGQSWADRLVSLERALAFRPEHLSCYELGFEDGTPFGEAHARGELAAPDEDAAADGFLATSAFLEDRGYVHYEVSNFARGDERRSRHNGKYWSHVPYLGLGPSAHSFDGGRLRWWNVPTMDAYCRRLADGDEAVEGHETLTPEQLRLERLALRFRTREGVAAEDLDGSPEAESLLERVVAEGLVVVAGGRVRPTVRGLRVADALARGFSGAGGLVSGPRPPISDSLSHRFSVG